MNRNQSSNNFSKSNRHVCAIMPPYILEAVAKSDAASSQARDAAQSTLASTASIKNHKPIQPIIPIDLLDAIIDSKDASLGAAKAAEVTRNASIEFKAQREAFQVNLRDSKVSAGLRRSVFDGLRASQLRASLARSEGGPLSQDVVVNECYDGFGHIFSFLWKTFGLNSLDDKGHSLIGTVHYGEKFSNALWNGEQMIFGDGDGIYFNRFTACIDVIAHELVHSVIAHLSGLNYHGESGALNESVCDVFGAMVKQHLLNQQSVDADWLIGEDLFTDKGQCVALRSMKAPGTAYNHPIFGEDQQTDHFDRYHHINEDDGGIHINSGIPNRAFYLVAVGLGGFSWEKAGQIWYHTLRGLKPTANFETFASLTVYHACRLYPGDPSVAKVVKDGWRTVGVLPEISFKGVFQTKSGVPGYDLKASVDLIFAFDYEHNGKMDHLALYRPGKGIFSIVKGVEMKGDDTKEVENRFEFQKVFSSRDGVGGFDLKRSTDRALAFDYDHSGKLDHIVFYRPGTGRTSVLKNTARTFEPVYESRNGFSGFDLSDPLDRIIAFDYESSGMVDHLVLYRRGGGDVCIVKNEDGVFSDVYSNDKGIGGYNLQSVDDRIIAFDYNQSGKRDHLILYRPGSGVVWILRNARGKFTPVYQQGVPATGDDQGGEGTTGDDEQGQGIGGYDLSSFSDRILAFDLDGSGNEDHLVLYQPGAGAFRVVKRVGDKFTPVHKQTRGGKGIGGFDLKNPNDAILAFDLGSTGVANGLVLYRPGKGDISVLQRGG